MNESLVAPCGMNCAICSGYLAYQHDVRSKGIKMSYCKGCRPRNKKCAFLKKRCDLLMYGQVEFCHECADFPCERLEHLDKGYRARYRMSMIENLEFIKSNGVKRFIADQEERWKCSECGGVICCHNGICFDCGIYKLKSKEARYRWED